MSDCIGYIVDLYSIVPVVCPTNHGAFELLEGPSNKEFESTSLNICLLYARQIAPFASWAFAPSWKHDSKIALAGCAAGNKAVVSTNLDKRSALQAVFHESWHLCEVLMNENALITLDSVLDTGIMWQNAYLDKPCERRAYAFANFAMMLASGCTIDVGSSATYEIRLFWQVFSGEFGDEMLAESKVPADSILVRTLGRLQNAYSRKPSTTVT